MHCLPVRRNVVVTDGVLDSPNNLVIEQANNRTYTAQAVLKYCRMADLHLIKVGGNLLEDSLIRKTLLPRRSKILVHGGGKSATILAEKMDWKYKWWRVGGLLIVNARKAYDLCRVAQQSNVGTNLGCNAIGLSGADGNAIRAVKRPVKKIDYGFVGDITKINTALLINFASLELFLFAVLDMTGKGNY